MKDLVSLRLDAACDDPTNGPQESKLRANDQVLHVEEYYSQAGDSDKLSCDDDGLGPDFSSCNADECGYCGHCAY